MQILKTIGKRIRVARIELEWKQEDLANKVHVAQKTVSGWESGNVEIGSLYLSKIAGALGKPIEYFYEPFASDVKNAPAERRKAA